jgi:hypothetical protein
MPDGGELLDLMVEWTANNAAQHGILVHTHAGL